ncbi:hypothetical protein ACET3Z_020811 [Daucus carota]
MGLVVANPDVELMPNLGLGREICGVNDPSFRHLKFRVLDSEVKVSSVQIEKCKAYSFPASVKLGKEKAYDELAFYADGSLTPKAIDILDSSALLHFSSVFGNPVLDLEAHIGKDMFAKDVSHYPCLGLITFMLEDNSGKATNLHELEDLSLMSVDNILSVMGLDSAKQEEDGTPGARN